MAGRPAGGTVTVCFNEWRAIFDRWAPLTEETYEHEASFRPEQVAAYYVSVSNVARLPVDEREALRSKLLELLDDGEYRLPLTARVFRTVRLDG